MNTVFKKFKANTITARWAKNILSVIIAVFLICFIACSIIIKNYYYSTVENFVSSSSSTAVSNYFNIYSDDGSFKEGAKGFIENYSGKDKVEIWVIDSDGDIIASSSGFRVEKQEMPDYDMALGSTNNSGKWIGRLPSGERVMACTKMINSSNINSRGAVRFISSLSAVDKQIASMIIFLGLMIVLLLIIVVFSNLYFIRSITNPVREIGKTANKIAHGDFNARIEKKADDELGVLCDTINYMAGEIAAADTMKNDFISTVSHELRTPLTSIKGWGETLIVDPLADPSLTHRGLRVIINESSRLGGFVEELLDFSRMQSGRMTLRLDKIDILAELDETVFVFKERALREGIEIQYNAPDIPAPAYADSNRIKQVFVNVMDNALKYNNEGGRVFVSAEIADQAIKIIVADNGCGISAADLPRVKEKFYKANISIKGSGIGLAVADEIISMHNGTLDLESVENEGTTVYITLPLMSAQNERNINNNE